VESENCNSRFLFSRARYSGRRTNQEWQGTFEPNLNNGGYTDDDIADVFTQRITTPLHITEWCSFRRSLSLARHQFDYGSGQDRRFTIISLTIWRVLTGVRSMIPGTS